MRGRVIANRRTVSVKGINMKTRFITKVAAFAACALLSPLGLLAAEVSVATTDELLAVIADANAGTETTVINLAAGTYELPVGADSDSDNVLFKLSAPVQIVGANCETTILTIEIPADNANARKKKVFFVLDHENALLKNVTVTGYYPQTDYKGAVHVVSGTVEACIFKTNNGDSNARVNGVSLKGGKLVNSRVGSSNSGVGVYVDGAATVENCVISGCKNVQIFGAGLYMTSSAKNAVVRNCLIYGNSSTADRGGVQVAGGLLEHCTICENSPRGIYVQNTPVIRNCIIWENGTSAHSFPANATVAQNILENSLTGGDEGNVYFDPLFSDPENGDFTLRSDSPAINAAIVADEDNPVTTDILGNPRSDPDLGCYEYQVPVGEVLCLIQATETVGFGRLEPTFTVSISGGAPDAAYTYQWYVDGQAIAGETGASATIPFNDFGHYVVTAIITDSPGKETTSAPCTVSVGARKLYCNTTGNGTWPYDTPDKATNDVCEILVSAVRVTGEQTEIEVGSGAYPINDDYAYLENVKLYAADASVKPSFHANRPNGNAAAFHAAGGSVIEGFAFTNWTLSAKSCVTVEGGSTIRDCIFDGVTNAVGGAALTLKNATGDGLVVRNNYSESNGGGVFLFGKYALLNSEVCNNACSGNGGGIMHETNSADSNGPSSISNCVVRGNIAGLKKDGSFNASAQGGGIFLGRPLRGIYDTEIIDNYSYGEGGGVYIPNFQMMFVDCLIAGNRAAKASSAQGVHIEIGASLFYNCTITANGSESDGTGVGVIIDGMQINKIHNTIISGNYGTEAIVNDATQFFNSCVPIDAITVDAATGKDANGNIKANPLFGSKYRLSPDSPCKNAGNNAYLTIKNDVTSNQSVTLTTDLDGNPRVNRHVVDMGCYEQFNVGMAIILR